MDKTFGEKTAGVRYYDRLGSYLVAIRENRLATVKTPRGFFLPGGGIEKDEDHEACIKRECIEETGFEVNIRCYICSAQTYGIHDRKGYFHPIQYYYYGEFLNKVTDPIEKDHIFQWISMDDLDEVMYVRSQAWAVQYYLDSMNV